MRLAALATGQRVLIHAAAGGIGHLAVQIAKARGAHVIGSARTAKHEFLRTLGADELIDYTTVDFSAAVRDIDVVLDPIGGDYGPRSLDTLRPGGTLIDVRGTGPDRAAVRQQAQARGLRFVEFGFTPNGADLDRITGLVEQGGLRVAVNPRLPARTRGQGPRTQRNRPRPRQDRSHGLEPHSPDGVPGQIKFPGNPAPEGAKRSCRMPGVQRDYTAGSVFVPARSHQRWCRSSRLPRPWPLIGIYDALPSTYSRIRV